MRNHHKENLPIIVIGAGIAGISCAKSLQDAGKTVYILEARNRIGGRIHSQYNAHACFDLGASWIHGIDQNPIWELTQKHQIKTAIFNYNQAQYFNENKAAFSALETQDLIQSIQKVQQYIAHIPQISAVDAVKEAISTLSYSSKAFTQDQLKRYLFSFFECLANDPFATNLENLASNYHQHEGYFSGDEVIFPQGYTQLIEALATSLDIKTGIDIQKITYHDGYVEIIDRNNRPYFASHVIVTVPLGVLKQNLIEFNLPLPQPYKHAIEQIGFGSFNKVFFQLKTPIPFISQSKKEPTSVFYWANQRLFNILDLSSIYQQPTYLMLFGGKTSEFIDHATDTAVWHFIAKSLQQNTQHPFLEAENLLITRWGLDPYSYGSFSFPKVDHCSTYTQQLAVPIQQRIFFAGEHCHSRYAATVHGAYLSGIETASRLLNTNSK